MHLITKNPVTVNNGIKGTVDVIVKGFIYVQQNSMHNEEGMKFQYSYNRTDTNEVLKANVIRISKEKQNELYNLVKENLPNINEVGFSLWYESLIFECFRLEMATTFEISPEEIEIVVK